jgi:hypothetical protein
MHTEPHPVRWGGGRGGGGEGGRRGGGGERRRGEEEGGGEEARFLPSKSHLFEETTSGENLVAKFPPKALT